VTDRDRRVVSSRGSRRVLVTKEQPAGRWPWLLTGADCCTEIAQGDDILAVGYDNVVLSHLGSASTWTREGMATLAAPDVEAILQVWPVWPAPYVLEDVLPFLEGEEPPHTAPSIVNADDLGLPRLAVGPQIKEDLQ
jgi:hypothetical protein